MYSLRQCIADIRNDLRSCGGTGFFSALYVRCWRADFQLLYLYRLSRYFYHRKYRIGILGMLRHRMLVRHACDIAPDALIGTDVRLPHPTGIVIGSGVVVGDHVTLYQQVTLGSHGKPELGKAYPTIGDGSVIYAGAKVIGGVTVGAHAVIAANSVVRTDVPDNAVVVGIPGHVIRIKADEH